MDYGGVNLSPGIFFAANNSNCDNESNAQNLSSIPIASILNIENSQELDQRNNVQDDKNLMPYFYEELGLKRPNSDAVIKTGEGKGIRTL